MTVIQKINKALMGIEDSVNGFLLLSATIVLFINVIMRYVFHSASTWAEEAIRYAIIWVTFFGGSICVRNKMHVGIDIFVMYAPKLLKKILSAFAQLTGAIFTGFVTYYGWQITVLVIETAQKSPAMLMPMWIVYISMPIGSALMTIRFLAMAWAILTEKSDEGQDLEKQNDLDLSRL